MNFGFAFASFKLWQSRSQTEMSRKHHVNRRLAWQAKKEQRIQTDSQLDDRRELLYDEIIDLVLNQRYKTNIVLVKDFASYNYLRRNGFLAIHAH